MTTFLAGLACGCILMPFVVAGIILWFEPIGDPIVESYDDWGCR